MSVRTEAGVSGRHIGRYVLDDLVAENAGSALWRATDPALQRPVGARLVPLTDPRIDALRAAAQHAAGIHDRRLVRVLDVVETDEYLAIVTEWVTGHSWSELLAERWSPQDSAVVALEVGRALESAHKVGVAHGRIRPDSVMITDTHEVRLRGLGVEAVLWGVDPAGDPRAADLHGIGALLYAGLTRRWPATNAGGAAIDGLSAAPVRHGHVQPPSSVAPEVPAALDVIVGRSLANGILPPGQYPFAGVADCVRSLERCQGQLASEEGASEYAEGTDRATDRLVGTLSTVAVFALAAAGIALLVWQLLANRASEPEPITASSPLPARVELPKFQQPLPEAPFTIVSDRDFDPNGDGEESHITRREAIDRSHDTAWVTESYAAADLDGKGGVGLVVDLGVVRPVKALDLKLVGMGTDFAIMTSRRKHDKLSDFRPIVSVTGAGDAIKVRTPRAINARFVLVWLTRLPFNGESYSGGLRTVKVVG